MRLGRIDCYKGKNEQVSWECGERVGNCGFRHKQNCRGNRHRLRNNQHKDSVYAGPSAGKTYASNAFGRFLGELHKPFVTVVFWSRRDLRLQKSKIAFDRTNGGRFRTWEGVRP